MAVASAPEQAVVGEDRPTLVYRLYGANGVLLYVGLSVNLAQRLGQHHTATWWDAVTRIEIERFPSRDAALRRERACIREMEPMHNGRGHSPEVTRARPSTTPITRATGEPDGRYTDEPREGFGVRLRPSLRRELDAFAKERAMTRTQVVEEAVRLYLKVKGLDKDAGNGR